MSAERATIQSVKNDIVIVNLPYLGDAKTTYLTADIAASGTSASAKDNVGLANNDYLILGEPGTQTAEIVKIGAAVTHGSAMTISATVFAHTVGTKVTQIRYNQVAIYGATSATETSPTIIGSLEVIDVAHNKNEIKASTTYAYYYAKYYNEQTTTYSSLSDSVASIGLTSKARGEIKKEFLSIFNEKLDALITDDWLNRTINRWQRELTKRKPTWSCLRTSTTSVLYQDKMNYTAPTDLFDATEESIISCKVKGEYPLSYWDATAFREQTSDFIGTTLAASIALVDTTVTLTNSYDFSSSGTINVNGDEITYTGNTVATGTLTGVTGITSTHTSGDEAWQTWTTGQPSHFTVDGGYIKLFPVPDSSWASTNLTIEYWRKFVSLDDDSDTTLFQWPENCYLYLNYQAAIRRKLSDDVILSRKAEWRNDLEDCVMNDADTDEIRIGPRNIYPISY